MIPCLFTACYFSSILGNNQTLPNIPKKTASYRFPTIQIKTHRDEPLLAGDGQDRVVGGWPTSSRINDDVDVLVHDGRRRRLREHYVQVLRLEHGLSRIEREPSKLGLDQVGPVLHDDPEELVAPRALPAAKENKIKLSRETAEKEERLLWDQM